MCAAGLLSSSRKYYSSILYLVSCVPSCRRCRLIVAAGNHCAPLLPLLLPSYILAPHRRRPVLSAPSFRIVEAIPDAPLPPAALSAALPSPPPSAAAPIAAAGGSNAHGIEDEPSEGRAVYSGEEDGRHGQVGARLEDLRAGDAQGRHDAALREGQPQRLRHVRTTRRVRYAKKEREGEKKRQRQEQRGKKEEKGSEKDVQVRDIDMNHFGCWVGE